MCTQSCNNLDQTAMELEKEVGTVTNPKPSANNCIKMMLEGKPTLLATQWKPRHLLNMQVLMNSKATKLLPFSWSFRRFQEEDIVKSSDILWYKQRISKTNYSSEEEETLSAHS